MNVAVNDSMCKNYNIITGKVGLGTWSTVADYSNVSVQNGAGTTLFTDQFANSANWTPTSGTWSLSNNIYSQTATSTDCRSVGANISDSVYTYSLKARKNSGNEGFLIIFGYKDANNFYWWNIGGWTNTQHAIEQCVSGTKTVVASAAGSVTTGKWYDIRIVVGKTKVLCYLDNVLIHTLNTATPLLYTSATLDENSKQLYLKVINTATSDVTTSLDFKGLTGFTGGVSTVLSSTSQTDENSLTEPLKVAPVTTTLGALTKSFSQTFKANSVTVMQLSTSDASAVSEEKGATEGVTFYPQITKDFIYLKGAGNETVQVSVFDLNGKTVLRKQVGEKGRLDLSSLSSAMYIIRAEKGGQYYSSKVIRE